VRSHGSGITSGMYAVPNQMQAVATGQARWAVGIGCRGSVNQSELGTTALLKVIWWDLRLACIGVNPAGDTGDVSPPKIGLRGTVMHYVPPIFSF